MRIDPNGNLAIDGAALLGGALFGGILFVLSVVLQPKSNVAKALGNIIHDGFEEIEKAISEFADKLIYKNWYEDKKKNII